MAGSDASTHKTPQQHHVMAVPLPAQGHINPLMRFCKLLAHHGFRVTFVNINPSGRMEDMTDVEGGGGAEEDDDGDYSHSNRNIRIVHIPVCLSLSVANDFRVSFEPFFEALNSIGPQLEALLLCLNRHGSPVTCLISSIGMTIPTQKLADKYNIPRIVSYANSARLQLLISYAIEGKRISAKQVLEGLKRAKTEIFSDLLPGLPTLLNKDLPDFKHVVDDNAYMWELIAQTWQQSESRAHAMVINCFEELEPVALKALSEGFRLPVYGIGPLAEPVHKEANLWKEDESCIVWLDKQPPLSVLYVSFGSITILSQLQLNEMLAALLSSQQRFLWVFRPDLVEGTTMPCEFALDVMSKSNGRGCVVNWAPQLRVLSHSSVGGFLSHCGWNSVIEAITHGMPMLCWPYFSDQYLDAKYIVEEWKIGLQFESSNNLVERGEIERAIKALMEGGDGHTFRENALRLKEVAHESLLPGGSSYRNLKTLVQSLNDLQAAK